MADKEIYIDGVKYKKIDSVSNAYPCQKCSFASDVTLFSYPERIYCNKTMCYHYLYDTCPLWKEKEN